MAEGVEGLTRDKTRNNKPGKERLPAATVQNVVASRWDRAREATYWTGRMLAKAAGVSCVQCSGILEATNWRPIHPHVQLSKIRIREKLKDVVGLYSTARPCGPFSRSTRKPDPALDRTQPGLPESPAAHGTMTHDYKRHGTTTLFAALNILDALSSAATWQRHRHQEFIRFVQYDRGAGPAGKVINASRRQLHNPQTSKVRQWLARLALDLPLHPTSASWLNAVEGFFGKAHPPAPWRGVFQSSLISNSPSPLRRRYHADPKPFVWTPDPKRVLALSNAGSKR